MKPIDQALGAIIGREATADELKKFYAVKDACGFAEHDSVWAMILAFGHYEILYGEIPKRIATEATKLIADHKLALVHASEAAERHVTANIVGGVAEAVRKAAKEVVESTNTILKADARKRFIIGASLSNGISAVVISVLCWAAYSLGINAATQRLVQSKTGSAQFSNLNDVQKMLACSSSEYQKRRDGDATYCIPFDEKTKRAGGWRIQ